MYWGVGIKTACPGTHYVNQLCKPHKDTPVSASQALELGCALPCKPQVIHIYISILIWEKTCNRAFGICLSELELFLLIWWSSVSWKQRLTRNLLCIKPLFLYRPAIPLVLCIPVLELTCVSAKPWPVRLAEGCRTWAERKGGSGPPILQAGSYWEGIRSIWT